MAFVFALCLSTVTVVVGCGSGGYAGSGLAPLSASNLTLDAGQSITISSTDPQGLPLSWTLAGSACAGTTCGKLSNATGPSTTYTAGQGLTSSMSVGVQALVAGTTNSRTVDIKVNPDPVLSSPPPAGVVGAAYSTQLTVTGGTAPMKLDLISGSLPPGLSFNAATNTVSGTPTASGNFNVVAQLTDASSVPDTVTATEVFVVSASSGGSGSGSGGNGGSGSGGSGNGGSGSGGSGSGGSGSGGNSVLAIQNSNLPAGTVGNAYGTTLQASGGSTPYAWSVAAGSLPAGLALAPATGVISGVPTTQGTSSLTVQVEDTLGATAFGAFSITVTSPSSTAALVFTDGVLPNGTVGVGYNATVGVTGGNSPYSCTITNGALPGGLNLGPNCLISGTPTAAGTTTIGVKASDSSNPVNTVSGAVAVTINPATTLILTSPVSATVGVPYSAAVGISGGTAPYSCALASGTLPVGLNLASNCSVSGTPSSVGSVSITVRATDAANPANTTTGAVTLTIAPAPLSISSSVPNGTVGVAYSSSVGVAGGTAPYSCSFAAGTLPTGLTLGANCLISGTPTVAGTASITVRTTDAANPANTTTGAVTLTIAPAPLSISSSVPNGTVGVAYSSAVGVAGGTAPYSCSLAAGTLPTGLTLGANCLISGTPTVAGTASITVKATDAANPAESTAGPVTLMVNAATVLSFSSPLAATVATPYTGTIGINGGTAPYSCLLTAGTLPQGLSLGNHCTLAGTPTAAGTASIMVQATDSSNPANTGNGSVTVTVNPAPTTLTVSSPPAATVSTPYTGTIPVTGGTAPYGCVIASGSLPAGLVLNPGCSLTGTPTTVGSSQVSVTATDSSSPAVSRTSTVIVTVNPLPALSFTGSAPNATVGVVYMQTLAATGGLGPYTYTLTSGSLPTGLMLSSGGQISGTPTTAGAFSFSVTATDSENTAQTATLPLVLLVTYPVTTNDAELLGPYTFLFQGYDDVAAGVLAYQTATIGSFTADGSGVINAGEMDANHQTSNPTGNTVASHRFIGSYTLGTDNRGLLTLTTLLANGAVDSTKTYTIAIKHPTAPATTATQGSLIEYDGNQTTGTRGSGSLLAQSATVSTTGLNGSYAFGLAGDTPCLPTCTVGIAAGPAAAVGTFTANAGSLTNGIGDTNIASTTYASAALGGSYGAPDANGRLSLSMNTAGLPAGVYPTDYVVYLANANQAFVMSVDKHSAFILLAGQAQLQTQAAFSAASATGPYVGYENTLPNPGLLGQTLTNVLNFSTATLFQGNGNGNGQCTTNAVDQGGTTALVNALSGLGSVASVLQTTLGSYTVLGESACSVASNGREVLNYVAPNVAVGGFITVTGNPPAPRVAYLYGPNQGFFLETGYAGLGHLEQQTGAPFSLATVQGEFIYGSTAASSLASTNASGVLIANGMGSANVILDENVGVGTVNVLQLGMTGAYPYSLTNANEGTYLFGSSEVLYAISPERFVLLDKNATSTSPSVALIY